LPVSSSRLTAGAGSLFAAPTANLGDRLVFSNGVILLAIFSGFLVWVFRGDTSRLIPLYAVGVFLSFTLSQAGMVVHWWREGRMSKRQFKMPRPETPRSGGNHTGENICRQWIGRWPLLSC
jgi:hypothetical protein